MTEKIYIFDFDHTIFNARDYRQALGQLIKNSPDISSEEIWEFLNKEPEKLENFMSEQSASFLFPQVKKYLQLLPGQKILLTHGDLNFQQKKVNASGVVDLFDQVEYVAPDKSKIDFIVGLLKQKTEINSEIFFINDNYNKRHRVLENDEVRQKFSERIKVIDIDNYDEGTGVSVEEFFIKLFEREGIVRELKNKNMKFI